MTLNHNSLDGNILVPVAYDPFLMAVDFAFTRQSLINLRLPKEHEEMRTTVSEWNTLNMTVDTGLTFDEFFERYTEEYILEELTARYFSQHKLAQMVRSSLYKVTLADTKFKEKWSIGDSEVLGKAFVLEILQEYLPPEIILKLCNRLSMSEPKKMPLYKPNGTDTENHPPNQANGSKKRSKSQTAFLEEAKTSKRISAFFKPRPAAQ